MKPGGRAKCTLRVDGRLRDGRPEGDAPPGLREWGRLTRGTVARPVWARALCGSPSPRRVTNDAEVCWKPFSERAGATTPAHHTLQRTCWSAAPPPSARLRHALRRSRPQPQCCTVALCLAGAMPQDQGQAYKLSQSASGRGLNKNRTWSCSCSGTRLSTVLPHRRGSSHATCPHRRRRRCHLAPELCCTWGTREGASSLRKTTAIGRYILGGSGAHTTAPEARHLPGGAARTHSWHCERSASRAVAAACTTANTVCSPHALHSPSPSQQNVKNRARPRPHQCHNPQSTQSKTSRWSCRPQTAPPQAQPSPRSPGAAARASAGGRAGRTRRGEACSGVRSGAVTARAGAPPPIAPRATRLAAPAARLRTSLPTCSSCFSSATVRRSSSGRLRYTSTGSDCIAPRRRRVCVQAAGVHARPATRAGLASGGRVPCISRHFPLLPGSHQPTPGQPPTHTCMRRATRSIRSDRLRVAGRPPGCAPAPPPGTPQPPPKPSNSRCRSVARQPCRRACSKEQRQGLGAAGRQGAPAWAP